MASLFSLDGVENASCMRNTHVTLLDSYVTQAAGWKQNAMVQRAAEMLCTTLGASLSDQRDEVKSAGAQSTNVYTLFWTR